ncbi:hypothetical protein [Pseudomonas sp. MWU13-2105]|uniref:hypothetical protein n=1 Tax=Pseudomonas sp. MWU13-2105 TaxID=2935074 RepID=UPI00200F1002|nr:hypothetical protein [Pseudomonas sp. MWU13-2105]
MSKNAKNSIAYNKAFNLPGDGRELNPPNIADAMPGAPTGLLPSDKLKTPIEVEIPIWNNRPTIDYPTRFDFLILEWLPDGEGIYQPIGTPDPVYGPPTTPDDHFPLPRTIPVSMFAQREGLFRFRYRVQSWLGEETESYTSNIIIDRTGPQLAPLDQSAIVVTRPVITDATLISDNGLPGTIPDFTEENNKAAVKAFVALLATVPQHFDDIDPADLYLADPLPPARNIVLPTRLVTQVGSGTRYLIYVLFDKAGNDSVISWPTLVQIALGALPSGLQALTVDAQEAYGLVDLKAADRGVYAIIQSFDNHEPYDRIRVTWKDEVMAPEPVVGAADFPIRVPMYWDKMSAAYNFAQGGEQTVQVVYSVLRGDYPTPYPTPYAVKVNFEYAGPVNPGIPGPNPLLNHAHAYDDDGTEDELRTENKDAKIKLILFDTSPVEMHGITVTFYWGGTAVATYLITGLEPADYEVERTLPWAEIEKVANDPAVKLYYTLTKPNVHNPHESEITEVDVDVITITLDPPTFPDLYDDFALTCGSLQQHTVGGSLVWGIWVHIPPSKYIHENDTVVATWQSYKMDRRTEIPDTDLRTVFTVSQEEETDGIDWFVPYEKHLKPTYGGNNDQTGMGLVEYGANGYFCEPTWVLVAMGAGPEAEDSCILPPPRLTTRK